MKIFSIKPEVHNLEDFFEDVAPQLCIPTIQRQFVWDEEDIKELLDSIISGYPIGAIIIWEPTAKFPSVPLTGKEIKVKNNLQYVLDGQQRLTALMLIKNHWRIERGTKEIKTSPISFIPETENFYISAKKGIDVSLILNAYIGDNDARTKLEEEYPTMWKKVRDTVGKGIAKYKLPFYILRSDTSERSFDQLYEKIAEIFTRVNSAGVKIGNLEMFLSFFAAAFPKEAKDKIISMHEEFSESFELKLEPIVRFVFSKMNMKQNQITRVSSFKKAIRGLKEEYFEKKREILKVICRSSKSIEVVTKLLDKEFGLPTTQYIPSQNALLPLFEYVYNQGYQNIDEISKGKRNKILKWFLIASFNGIYSSAPNSKIDRDLDIIRKGTKRFPLDKLLTVMKENLKTKTIERGDIVKKYTDVYRSKEYLMLIYILLYRNKATDLGAKVIRSNNVDVHHIFPREKLKEFGETRRYMLNCLPNLTFISSSVNSQIGDTLPSEYLPDYKREILDQHFIPVNKNLWKIENYEKFLNKRSTILWKAIKKLLESLE